MAINHPKLLEEHRVMGGSQRKYQHYSAVLDCPMTFSLYVPKVTGDTALDLVWWLSGLTCTDDNFSQKGAFQAAANQYQQAVVIPDTSPRGAEVADDTAWDLGQGAGFYLNATQAPWNKHYQMADYLETELPALIAQLLPNWSGNESILGHSMGGHGALVLGLRNPQRFQAISAFAPILTPQSVPWGQKAFTAYLGTDKAAWSAWDATALLGTAAQVAPIFITQGEADPFYPEQLSETAFLAVASEVGAPVTYQKVAGYDHSYFTIATFIAEHLAFHKAAIKKS